MDLSTLGKSDLKKRIRELRGVIGEALSAGNRKDVKKLRRQVKRLKRRTRVLAAGKTPPAGAAPAATPQTPESGG